MKEVVVLGVFVADVAFRTKRIPQIGETLMGTLFKLGPGGKGSNQAAAARRAGAEVSFITMLGRDPFARIALELYATEGIRTDLIFQTEERDTGAADIIIDDATGDNAIIVVPGSADLLTPQHVEQAAARIAEAAIFLTNFELPVPTLRRGLELARAHQVPTLLNPAPATAVPPDVFQLADYVTPNEAEASAFTGLAVRSPAEARQAAQKFRELGAQHAIITLGEQGCYVLNDELDEHIPTFAMGDRVVETTGAGDAFNGGLAFALASGQPLREALHFANATAALSVTRSGTAPAMPTRVEIEQLLRTGAQA
jgi:ribokinase